MTAARYGQSPWLDRITKAQRPSYPKFSGTLEIPIAIVGGGIAGCATAYALAAAGQRVAIFEADRVAGGATAQAAGLLLASPGTDYLVLEKAHGRKVARALWQDTRRSALDAQATLRRLKIRCDLQPADVIVTAQGSQDVKLLRRELALQKEAGIEGAWVSGAALEKASGIEGGGGVKSSGHASLDPYRAAIGFARAAAVRGAAVFERTEVHSIKHTQTGVELVAGTGRVKARTVIRRHRHASAALQCALETFRRCGNVFGPHAAAWRRDQARRRQPRGHLDRSSGAAAPPVLDL